MDGPSIGSAATRQATVTEADTAVALGSGDVDVLGTPRVVALVEEAAVAALAGRLESQVTTVGIHIDLQHLAPSPIGSVVVASAEVTAIEGKTVTFAVEATMGDRLVARGTHRRVQVVRDGFGQPR